METRETKTTAISSVLLWQQGISTMMASTISLQVHRKRRARAAWFLSGLEAPLVKRLRFDAVAGSCGHAIGEIIAEAVREAEGGTAPQVAPGDRHGRAGCRSVEVPCGARDARAERQVDVDPADRPADRHGDSIRFQFELLFESGQVPLWAKL